MNGSNALEALEIGPLSGGFKVFYPENNGREGLFINLQAMLVALFGITEPWVLRLASAFFGVITVVGVYAFLKESLKNHRKREWIALAGSFLLAISFWHVNFSRIGFRAIMASAFLTWSLFFLLKWFNREKNPEFGIKNWIPPIIAGIVYGLGFYSYIAYRATPLLLLALGIYWWVKNKDAVFRQRLLRAAGLFAISAIIVMLPLISYFFSNPADFFGRTTQVSVFSAPSPLGDLAKNIGLTAGMFFLFGDGNWRHNISGAPQLFWPVAVLFLGGIFWGARSLFKKEEYSTEKEQEGGLFWISFWWLAVASLPVVISNEGIPHALRAIIMIPPAFFLAALGVVKIYAFLSRYVGNKAIVITSFLAGLLLIQGYISYFIVWAKNPHVADAFSSRYVDIGRQIKETHPSLKKYVVVNADGVLVRGIPMPAQTVMFISDTFTESKKTAKNVFYVIEEEEKDIPSDALVFYLEEKRTER